MPLSSQEIKERTDLTEADRPYRVGEERADKMRGLVGLGRSQSRGPQGPTTDQRQAQIGEQGGPTPPMGTPNGEPPPSQPPPEPIQISHPDRMGRSALDRGALPERDPLAVLSMVGEAAQGIGDLVAGGVAWSVRAAEHSNIPKVRAVAGLLRSGAVRDLMEAPVAPLGAAAIVSGDPAAQAAFDQTPHDDLAGVEHALAAAVQARGGTLAGIAYDETAPVGDRLKAALGAGLYALLPNVIAGGEGALAVGTVRGAVKGAARAAEALPGALEATVGEVAPGAGAFASRQAERVVRERKVPPTSYEGQTVEFAANGGTMRGRVVAKMPDSEHYIIQAEGDAEPRYVIDRFRVVRDEATVASDEAEVGTALRSARGGLSEEDRARLGQEYGKARRTETVETTRVETSLSPEDAARLATTKPLSVRNEAVRRATGINPSRLDPRISAELSEAVEREPDAFSGYTRTVSDPELLSRSARVMGASTEDLTARMKEMGLTDPGEVSSFVHASNVRVAQLLNDVYQARSAGLWDAADTASIDLVNFSRLVGGTNSELGRSLRSLQMTRSLAIVGALRTRTVVERAEREVAAAERSVSKANTDLVKAAARKDANLENKAKRLIEREERRLSEARTAAVNAKDKLASEGQKAKVAAYLKAMGERADDPSIAEAIMMADPTDPVALAKAIGRMEKHSRGQAYITAVMSGAYSGPLGHVRSAMGALLNIIDDEALSLGAQTLGLPGFARGEWRGRMSGIAESLRTFGTMTGRYWVDRVPPSVTLGAAGFEDIRGPMLTGAARPLGFTLEAHGYYHDVGVHIMSMAETNALFMKRAIRDAGKGASREKVADVYSRLVSEMPDDLVDQANRLALDRRYIAQQSDIAERLLKVVSWSPDLPVLGPTPILRPWFVAARFGLGFAARQIEVSGGGLVRAAKMGVGDVRSMERRALAEQARLDAIKTLGPEAGEKVLRAKAAEMLKDPSDEMRREAMASIETERDYVMREASKAGLRGAIGAAQFGYAYSLAASGQIKREGFETVAQTPFGPMNLTWLMPYSAPYVFASIAHDAVSKRQIKDAHIDQLVVGTALALGQNLVDSDSLSQVRVIDDVLNGRGGRRAMQELGQVAARLLVPGFSVAAREADRMLDGGARDARTWDEYLRYYVPLARRTLRPALTPLGDEKPDAPQGAQRLNPAAAYRTTESEPILREDQRLAGQQALGYKGLSRPNETWGTKDDQIKLDAKQQWEYEKRVGQVRRVVIGALMGSDPYAKAADDKAKLALWQKADEAARRQARRDMGIEFAAKGDPRNLTKFVRAAYSANGDGRRETALWLLQLSHEGALSAPIEGALNKLITDHEKKLHTTLDLRGYLRVAPEVQTYLQMRPFTVGDPAEWAKVKDIRAEYTALQRDDPIRAGAFYRSQPLLRRYERGQNTAREMYRDRHPEIARFIEGSTYIWLR